MSVSRVLAATIAGALCAALGVPRLASAEEKRALPDYDGREAPADSPGRKLLWVPRVLLYPVYLASEYLIRWPLGKVLSSAERAGVPGLLYDAFAFGPDHKSGIFPTVFVDSGFQPSIGAFAFWQDAGFRGHDLNLRGSFSGNSWLSLGFAERYRYSNNPADRIGWDMSLLRRPDYAYFGSGPSTLQSDLLRYGMEALQARATVDQGLWRRSSVHAQVAVREVNYRPGNGSDDGTLQDAIASGAVPPPPFYETGYSEVRSELKVIVDSRQLERSGSGLRFQGLGRYSSDLQNHGSWLRYGAIAGAFVDVDGHRRVLSLAGGVQFVDPLGSSVIPFTEYVALGGDSQAMVGFLAGRLIGQSATALSLTYRWPIWMWLDGSLRFEVGNVFDTHLADFRPGLLRYSAAVAIESRITGESEFQAVLGLGSNPFETGGQIDSIRFTLGTSYDF